MATLNRICVPLSLDCNLQCKYCYRNHDTRIKIPDFSDKMIDYLGHLSPETTEAVIANGGETLLHWDKVLELFSYVPKNVHKKLMTNGVLLTQEIVNYINENEIELAISHDGPKTKFLRGIDILEDNNIVKLLQQVNILRIMSVTTGFNPDVWENFFDTVKKLKQYDFSYIPSQLLDCPEQEYLVQNMDYNIWFTTWTQFIVSPYHRELIWYHNDTLKPNKFKKRINYKYGKRGQFNVLPDGTVCDMQKITADYGKIWDSLEDIYSAMLKNEDFSYCINCEYNNKCKYPIPCYSNHVYKIRTMSNHFFTDPEKRKETEIFVRNHIHDIEKKYLV
jgi:MoaA/NifB/PqqE/SkfB family radical SAM enzyme